MFRVGAVSVILGGQLVRGEFDRYDRAVSHARGSASKPIMARLGGDLSKDSFDRYARHLHASGVQTKGFATSARGSFGLVDASMRHTAESASRYLGQVRGQLGYLAGEYETVAAAAAHSAESQQAAMSKIVSGGKTAAAAEAKNAAKASSSWKKGYAQVATMGKWTTIGAAVVGGVSLKFAADFQKQMTLVHTQAGYTQPEVAKLTKEILKLAPAVGMGPSKLAEGLFHLASSGVSAGKAMGVLRIAAEGAKVGNAGMEDVTNALVAILNTAPKDIKGASDAMGVMNDIVGHGNLRMKDLVGAMTTGLVPAAKGVQLGLRDVGAALDTLTARGVPAEEAATRLRTALNLVANPTAKARKALAELGISSTQLAEDFQKKGLVGALQDLQGRLDKTFPKGRKLTVDETRKALAEYNLQLNALGVTGKARDKDVAAFTASLTKSGTAAIKQSQILSSAFGGARIGTTFEILMQNVDDVKKHFDELNRANAAGRFDAAWKATEQTFSAKMDKILAGLQVLGIRIGDWLIPKVEAAITAIGKFFGWLGRHKVIADGLAYTLGTVLVVAVTTFVAKFLISMGKAVGSMAQFVAQVAKAPLALAKLVAGTNAQAVATDKLTASIVAEGEAAAAASVEMGRLAMTGESVTAGQLILPRGMTKGGIQGTENAILGRGGAAAATGATGLRGLLGTGASRLGRGAGVALTGTIASQLLGQVIGGSVGKLVGTAGTTASVGAGLGMLFGPTGAIAGGVIGGLVGAFGSFLGGHKGEQYGKKIAGQVEKGMGSIGIKLAAPDKKNIEKAGNDLGKAQKAVAEAADKAAYAATSHAINVPHGAATQQAQGMDVITRLRKEAEAARKTLPALMQRLGEAAAAGFSAGVNTTHEFWTAGTLFKGMRKQLNALPADARAAAANSMVEMASTLERDGRLPRGATGRLVRQLEVNYDGLGGAIKFSTHRAMLEAQTEIQKNGVVKASQGLVDDITHRWADAPVVAKLTGENIQKNFSTEIEFLRHKVKTSTGHMKDEASGQLHGLEQAAAHWSSLTKQRAGQNYLDLTSGVSGLMSALGAAVDQGLSAIGIDTSGALKELGGKAVHLIKANPKKAAHAAGSALGTAASIMGALLKAEGGYANASGSAADDHILYSPSGDPVAALSGTEGIFNKPQMSVVDYALNATSAMGLQPFGSKEDLWGSGMRHYASGGILGRADALQRMHLPYIWGGHHGDKGAIKNPHPGLDCSSAVSYVLGVPPRVSSQFENFGQPGPGPVSIFANAGHAFMKIGSRFFGTSGFGHPKEGTGPAWFTKNPDASYLSKFVVRHVPLDYNGGAGLSVQMPIISAAHGTAWGASQLALHRTTSAANRFLDKTAVGAGGGQHLNDFSTVAGTPARAQKWTEQAMGLAGVGGPSWAIMLQNQESHESSFNPRAINLTDINAQQGHPSKGIMQIIDPNFQQFHVKGHNNTWNPVDNIAAAIKYIISRYGHGNKARALSTMIARGGAAYAKGGLLRRFARGGPLARGASKRPPVLHRPKAFPKAKAHHKSGKNRAKAHTQILPHHLGSLVKFDKLPGISPLDEADKAIAAYDATYTREAAYFNVVDASLTPADLTVLLGLRGQTADLLGQEETLAGQAETTLTGQATTLSGREATVRHAAEKVAKQLTAAKRKLVLEGRRLAKLRHVRAGKMMQIASSLAKRVASNADAQDKLAKREQAIRKSYRDKLFTLHSSAPKDDTAGPIAGIRNRYKARIGAAMTTAETRSLERSRDAEIAGVRGAYKAKVRSHQQRVRDTEHAQQRALDPIRAQKHGLTTATRHLRFEEATNRRKYQKQGWSQAWGIQTKEWKLQDKIKSLAATEKELSGSTTGVGTSGILGQIVKQEGVVATALTDLHTKADALPGEIQDNALDQLDLAGQKAQAQADHTQLPVDLATVLPQSAADVLIKAGLVPAGGIHRIYQPGAPTDSTGATTDQTVAQQVQAQLAAMDQASQSLFSQFGSNLVAPAALKAALAGGAFAPGVRYFGAAGAAQDVGTGLTATGGGGPQSPQNEQNFYQTNHYAMGPPDPHIHAQASRLEFETAFG